MNFDPILATAVAGRLTLHHVGNQHPADAGEKLSVRKQCPQKRRDGAYQRPEAPPPPNDPPPPPEECELELEYDRDEPDELDEPPLPE